MQKVSRKIKFLYGLGFSAKGIKDGLFQIFVFYYFNQILGLDSALTGVAVMIALFFDAITDPLVGLISDKWKSEKWGRRHPFMFASAIPLGLFTWLLFIPPSDLSQLHLFLWLTTFSILLRFSLTLFMVPGMSLGAELSTDYNERTSITGARIMFSALITAFIIVFGLLTFFVPEEGMKNGMERADAYPKFGLLSAILMIVVIFISTWGTKSVIPRLPKASKSQLERSFFSFMQDLKIAFSMSSYRAILGYTIVVYTAMGIGIVFTPYFLFNFFELTEKELVALSIGSAIGGIIAMGLAPWMSQKMDKKRATIISTILFGVFFSLPYNLRILGLFPENGDPALLAYFLLLVTIAYIFIWIALSLANSMMAEIVDEYELRTNNRQEGLFFSSISFAFKCSSGLGYLFAGFLLKWIDFPAKAASRNIEVSAEVLEGMAYIGGPILMCSYLFSLVFLLAYPIDKERYEEIRLGLDGR